MEMTRTIKYEADRVKGFGEEVMSVPGCEKLKDCIQCGTCSGVCPLSIYMDFTPRQVIEMTRFDFKNEVLGSKTIWLCASCYACSVECPQQIGITDIMYELKQRAIKEKVYPRGLPTPVLAQEFTKMVHDYGRVNEILLATKMYMKTNPLAAMGMSTLGLSMIKTGRFSMIQEKIQGRADLARMLETVDEGK